MATPLSTIDVSASDPDGNPNCASIVSAGDKIFVSCQLLDDGTFTPRGPGMVAVIDPSSDTVIDTLTLANDNPFSYLLATPAAGGFALPAHPDGERGGWQQGRDAGPDDSQMHDVRGAVALSREYAPESSLQGINDALGARVASLRPGPEAAAVRTESQAFVVQVVDRIPAGTLPPIDVLRSELTERLTIQLRRDSEARLLQRLRSEAIAADRIEIR